MGSLMVLGLTPCLRRTRRIEYWLEWIARERVVGDLEYVVRRGEWWGLFILCLMVSISIRGMYELRRN